VKTRRSRFTLPALSLLLGIGLLVGNVSTFAVPLVSTIRIPIAGTVTAPTESVSLSGTAEITSTLVLDPLLGAPPREIVSIKLVNVSGIGLLTGARYVATGQNTLLRLLVTSDVLEITFPYFSDTAGGASRARSLLASFTLNYNLFTGALTTGTATFSTPNLGV
jgi:hypothetical protein